MREGAAAEAAAAPSPTRQPMLDVRKGVRLVLLDNLLRPAEPLLVLACASAFAGGEWGAFKLAESMAYLGYRLAMLGFDRGVIWWHGQTDEERYRKDLFGALGMVVTAGLVLGVVLAVLGELTTPSMRGVSLSVGQIASIFLTVPVLALADVLYQANLNRGDMLARILGKNIVLPGILFGGALLSHMVHGPGLATWFLIASVANLLVAGGMFVRLHGVGWADLKPRLPSVDLRRFSFPLIGSDLLAGLMGRVDLVLLAELADVRAIEVYNVVTMIGRTLQSIRQSFDGLLLSRFSADGVREFDPARQRSLDKATDGVGRLMGWAFFGLAFWGRPLLGLLHPQYADGHLALVVLAAATFLNVRGDLSGIMLQGIGRSRAWVNAQAVAFVVNIAGNLAWIPAWGALGGVLALAASSLVQGWLSLLALVRGSGAPVWNGRRAFRILLVVVSGVASIWPPLSMLWRGVLFLAVVAAWLWLCPRPRLEDPAPAVAGEPTA